MEKYQSLRSDIPGQADSDEETEIEASGVLKGLSPFVAGTFIVAEIAGAGVLALPKALSSIGYPALIAYVVVGVVMLYAGVLLGRSWLQVYGAKRTEQPIRDPYPFIAEEAYGSFARGGVIFLITMHCFFVAAVYIIMPAQMISSMLHLEIPGITERNSIRLWSFLFALVITPLTWLESPKDNWFTAIVGSLSTIVSVICILVSFFFLNISNWKTTITRNTIAGSLYPVEVFAISIGIFISAFTGGVIFPTIQTDMKKPSKFTSALIVGYIGCALLYTPVMIGGEIVFDGHVNDNILLSLIESFTKSSKPKVVQMLVYTAVASFVLHFVAGAVIQSNPINQLVESYIDVPEGCSFKRCFTRTIFMVLVVVMAVLVPNFTPILSFLGGTVNMFLSIIFPVSFYIRLHPEAPKWEKTLIYCIIVSGLFLAGLIGYINALGMYRTMVSS